MSFNIEWPPNGFPEDFLESVVNKLEEVLNSGPISSHKPTNICDRITVKSISLGTIPPQLEILELVEISNEKFKALFRLVYTGDAELTLSTKVQANPVGASHSRNFSAHKPLILPLLLTFSGLKLKGIFSFDYSSSKGVSLCFKNDPLENLSVKSSFDSIPGVSAWLQKEIAEKLKEFFREDLPQFIHKYSKDLVTKQKQQINQTKSIPANSLQRSKSPPPRPLYHKYFEPYHYYDAMCSNNLILEEDIFHDPSTFPLYYHSGRMIILDGSNSWLHKLSGNDYGADDGLRNINLYHLNEDSTQKNYLYRRSFSHNSGGIRAATVGNNSLIFDDNYFQKPPSPIVQSAAPSVYSSPVSSRRHSIHEILPDIVNQTDSLKPTVGNLNKLSTLGSSQLSLSTFTRNIPSKVKFRSTPKRK